jgi:hypothetical protein
MPRNLNKIVRPKFGFRPKLPAQLLFHVDEKSALAVMRRKIVRPKFGFRPKLPAQLLFHVDEKSALAVMRRKHAEDGKGSVAHLKFGIQIEKLFARE